MAIQNLAWGFFGVFAGMAADRFGAFRVLVTGALLYGAGLAGMALSHNAFAFMGVWLGGLLYDRTGSYDIVWYIAIALGVFAAMVNLPVREAPIARMPQAA
jgi:MFS family permease